MRHAKVAVDAEGTSVYDIGLAGAGFALHTKTSRREKRVSNCIFVLNGPNLNLLGEREPHIYGTTSLAEVKALCESRAGELGYTVDFRQTNFEGELIESVHEARAKACGIIINPAGYTFTSIALLDSLKMFDRPKIELHISNVHTRESIYHNSLISRTATGIIIGLGVAGYGLAIQAMAGLVRRD